MKFISLEDETGVVEAVLLPEAYQRLGGRVTTRGPYLVTGTVEDHYGAISLIVSDVRHLARRGTACRRFRRNQNNSPCSPGGRPGAATDSRKGYASRRGVGTGTRSPESFERIWRALAGAWPR